MQEREKLGERDCIITLSLIFQEHQAPDEPCHPICKSQKVHLWDGGYSGNACFSVGSGYF